jgi:hypothetical protein
MNSKKLLCCRIKFGDNEIERFVSSAQAVLGFSELVDDETEVTFFLKDVLVSAES